MKMKFADAIEAVIIQAMISDPSILIFGEDIHAIRTNLFTRFGKRRIKSTPISEGAFVGAAVTAAMAGLRPIVEVMMVDFTAVAMDAILNHMAKVYDFSGHQWNVPLVLRVGCGGGYGDGGQHEQALWGWLAHIPGLQIVIPSNPADAGGLMLSALQSPHPVIYLEHKLLAAYWRDYLGSGGRRTVHYDIPEEGAEGEIPDNWTPIPFGSASICRSGKDLTLVSVGVGVHRCLEAATQLNLQNIEAEVIDLRTLCPLDSETILRSVQNTGRLLVVDEDYRDFGLSGEIAARILEAQIPCQFGRVCTNTTIPFARHLEDATLPNVKRILAASFELLDKPKKH